MRYRDSAPLRGHGQPFSLFALAVTITIPSGQDTWPAPSAGRQPETARTSIFQYLTRSRIRWLFAKGRRSFSQLDSLG